MQIPESSFAQSVLLSPFRLDVLVQPLRAILEKTWIEVAFMLRKYTAVYSPVNGLEELKNLSCAWEFGWMTPV